LDGPDNLDVLLQLGVAASARDVKGTDNAQDFDLPG
jgi:hypothetical protein